MDGPFREERAFVVEGQMLMEAVLMSGVGAAVLMMFASAATNGAIASHEEVDQWMDEVGVELGFRRASPGIVGVRQGRAFSVEVGRSLHCEVRLRSDPPVELHLDLLRNVATTLPSAPRRLRISHGQLVHDHAGPLSNLLEHLDLLAAAADVIDDLHSRQYTELADQLGLELQRGAAVLTGEIDGVSVRVAGMLWSCEVTAAISPPMSGSIRAGGGGEPIGDVILDGRLVVHGEARSRLAGRVDDDVRASLLELFGEEDGARVVDGAVALSRPGGREGLELAVRRCVRVAAILSETDDVAAHEP